MINIHLINDHSDSDLQLLGLEREQLKRDLLNGPGRETGVAHWDFILPKSFVIYQHYIYRIDYFILFRLRQYTRDSVISHQIEKYKRMHPDMRLQDIVYSSMEIAAANDHDCRFQKKTPMSFLQS